MQALASLAHEHGQPALDVEMDVLGVERPGEPAALDFTPNAREAALDGAQIGFADNAGRGQHARMRERPDDIVLGEAAIEVDRGGEALYALGDGGPETARPGLGRSLHGRIISF